MLCYALFTGLCVAALVAAEHRGARPGVVVAKLAASTCFVLTAIAAGGRDSFYGRAVLVGLALSWAGDAALLSRARGAFLAGLAAFLLAHLAYGAAFALHGIDVWWALAAVGVAIVASRAVSGWLDPHVPAAMKKPVDLYVTAITAMVALAFGAVGAGAPARIGVAAVMFYASDIAVARERFVAKGFENKAWGLPLYYAAQVLFATTAGG